MSDSVVIGIDGGGTRLRAAIVSVSGELLGTGESGAGNYHDVGADEVQKNVGQAVANAWVDAGFVARRAEAIFLGLGSVVTPEDHAVIRSLVRKLAIVPDDRIGVDHDLRVALAGGLAGKPGIVLIAGTGSSCFGRNEQGECWQSGGWGPILDDPGSSYWLGLQAMIVAVRDHDGRGAETVLRQKIVQALALPAIRDILRRVELDGMTRSEIAALAPLVTSAAENGDAVALELIERGAAELALMVATVSERLQFEQSKNGVPVVITGGLVNAGKVFLAPLQRAIGRRAPNTNVVEGRLSPVLGAALLACELSGVATSDQLVERLMSSSANRRTASVA